MFDMNDADYKCSLSEADLEKSKRELGEKPETRLLEVNTLRSRVKKTPGLKSRTDINFLLPFLRVRKFNQERAYHQIQTYYDWKREKAEIFDDLKPSRVKHMLNANIIEVLKDRNKEGCRIIIWRAINWDEDRFSATECLKLYALTLLKMQQEEDTQVHGTHFIIDLGKLTWKQGMMFTPSVAKFYINMCQNIVPLRVKRIDYVNYPHFWDPIYQIFKQFMKDKIVKRVCLNGEHLEGLYSAVDPTILPMDLGGNVEPYSNHEWKDSIMNSEKEFEEDNKYGYLNMDVRNDRKEAAKWNAELSGLGGTFKKLDV